MMKLRYTALTLMLASMLFSAPVEAQPGGRGLGERGSDHLGERSERSEGRERGGDRTRYRAHRPIERWMETIREEDPEEHVRLTRLQEEDPEAFSEALRDRLNQRAQQHVASEYPRLHVLIEKLSEEEREEILASLRRLGVEQPTWRRSRRPSTPPEASPWASAIQRYREQIEADPQKKQAAQAELRTGLVEAYDQRTEQFEANIQRAERQLQELRDMLKKHRAEKDERIERQMQRLLESE